MAFSDQTVLLRCMDQEEGRERERVGDITESVTKQAIPMLNK